MYRIFAAFFFMLMLTSSAYAGSQVEIITRFNTVSANGQFPHEVAQLLNEMQDEYDFRVSFLPGAGGDAADLKAISMARSGQNVIIWNSTTAYSFNRFTNGNLYDRDNDVVPVYGFTSANFSIMVNPESKIKTFDDFIKMRREKNNVFFGTTVNGISNVFLNAVLEKSFGLSPAKHLEYVRPTDILKSVLIDESDYTIFSTNEMIGLKPIVTSNTKQVKGLPTGKEVGMEDFRFGSLTGATVPKEKKEFADKILPFLEKICVDPKFLSRVEKFGATSNCTNASDMKAKIQDEIHLIRKYEKDIVFKR
jgi:tripartite-type tricarboxylate transporter receptor subunit TctC